ncbi:uncharacterized protein LOC112507081 [Cynara cardunculus var. scolymus]|uniref:Uncharacterized protein n=1 Tax=Cynara cardunculus var. scolymus TaxID=59895 RepID=A0A103YN24_CYNCS|nr:uncharacterized protein LOC112507081 [Cynara cardunculus var. scolymus]KVI12129.1 hypothetical protein Ccrd_009476 [Cynara cardunculus var. scolymus]
MAQELADGEFWLPPEFLNDEDILMDFLPGKPNSGTRSKQGSSGFYGFGSNGPNSDLSSPVESVMGSTETESDEEDYLGGLTRKFAGTTLQEDFWRSDASLNFENHLSKSTRVMAGSPQSTLCGCKQGGSSRGSPNCSSPPATAAPVKRNDPSLDLLHAAAGEVARMRMVEEAAARYYNANKNFLAAQPPRRTPSHSLHYQQLQVAQFQQLRQQQMAKQQQYLEMIQQHRARSEGGNGRPVVAPPLSAWPTPQQSQQQPQTRPPGSGMRAVFLGNPNTKRESTGTGVFLPRHIGAPTEPLKKRGCSTVLLPDRVVQALNLNLEAMEAESKLQSRCNGGPLAPDYDAEMIYRSSVLMAQQRRNNHRQQAAEFRLPQEWTY